MRTTYVVAAIVASLFVIACGGNLVPPQPIPEAFAGRWVGAASVKIGDDAPRGYDAFATVDANGDVAHVGGFCPDGSGDADMISFEGRLGWEGMIECQPTWLAGCRVVFRYTLAKATLSLDSVLTIEASGTAERTPLTSACADEPSLTMHFTGVRG